MLIKVKITTSHFRHQGTTYSVGHELDLDPEYFDPTRMVKVIDESPVVTVSTSDTPVDLTVINPVAEPDPVVEPVDLEDAVTVSEEPDVVKVKRKRRRRPSRV